MRAGWLASVCVIGVTAACSGSTAPPLLHGAPRSYLLSLDQLVAPGFTLDSAPQLLSINDIALGDATLATQLSSAGYTTGAAEDFFRASPDIAVLNGPAQVGDTVEEFATSAGAASIYTRDVAHLDSVAGAAAVSTGVLGDEAHATTRVVTAPDTGVQLIQVSVEWRVANVLDSLTVRGRYGGTRLEDALVLAHAQTVLELGLPTPTPPPTPTPSPSPAPPSPGASSPSALRYTASD